MKLESVRQAYDNSDKTAIDFGHHLYGMEFPIDNFEGIPSNTQSIDEFVYELNECIIIGSASKLEVLNMINKYLAQECINKPEMINPCIEKYKELCKSVDKLGQFDEVVSVFAQFCLRKKLTD